MVTSVYVFGPIVIYLVRESLVPYFSTLHFVLSFCSFFVFLLSFEQFSATYFCILSIASGGSNIWDFFGFYSELASALINGLTLMDRATKWEGFKLSNTSIWREHVCFSRHSRIPSCSSGSWLKSDCKQSVMGEQSILVKFPFHKYSFSMSGTLSTG